MECGRIVEKVAVVILNYNTFEDAVICVDSIKNLTKGVAYKIYLVDNASPDGSGKQLDEKYGDDLDVEVIISESNRGFSGGNNLGIQAALKEGYEYIYLLNSDIILTNDALSLMQEAFKSSSDIAVVGPAVFSKENKYMQYARKGITLTTYLSSQRSLSTLFPKLNDKLRYFSFNQSEDFASEGMVSGCCFGMRANFIRQNNCMDENVFMYYEEDILAHLMKESGQKAKIAAKAQVIHNEAVSTKKNGVDHLLFTRFYRWTSVLYVLKNYAKVNAFLCKMMSMQNILIWHMLSLTNKKYRQKLREFIFENKKMLKKAI